MLKAIKGENSSAFIQEKLVEWHQRFAGLIQNGFSNPEVFYYQLIIERNYSNMLNIATDFYYHHAMEVISTHPELFSGYHFAGTYLYENGRYAEAIPLLEKATVISSNATAWRRKAESEYHLYKTVTAEIPEFSDHPADIYNEGVYMNEFIDELEDENDRLQWTEVSRIVYEQAYEAFRKYFEEGKWESDYHNDLHTRAMCCNNLAIKYSLLGNYQAAAETASEGLTYSEFMELHLVLIDALLDGGTMKGQKKHLPPISVFTGNPKIIFTKIYIIKQGGFSYMKFREVIMSAGKLRTCLPISTGTAWKIRKLMIMITGIWKPVKIYWKAFCLKICTQKIRIQEDLIMKRLRNVFHRSPILSMP